MHLRSFGVLSTVLPDRSVLPRFPLEDLLGLCFLTLSPALAATRLETCRCGVDSAISRRLHLRVLIGRSSVSDLYRRRGWPLVGTARVCSLSLFKTLTFKIWGTTGVSNLSLALGREECCSSLWFVFPAFYMFLVSVWPWEEPGVSLLSSVSGAILRTGVSTLRLHTYLQKRLQFVHPIFDPSGVSLSYNKNAILK